jgi:hypothetical protein
MLRLRRVAVLRAALASLILTEAACAHAPAAFAFEVVPPPKTVQRPHRAAWACAVAGAGLVGASFPLTSSANRRYRAYLDEGDPAAIPARWDASVRADRTATASLLAGEALLVGAAWLGFVHRPHESHVALEVSPARCALSCRF